MSCNSSIMTELPLRRELDLVAVPPLVDDGIEVFWVDRRGSVKISAGLCSKWLNLVLQRCIRASVCAF